MSREVLEITRLSDFVQHRVDGVTMCDEHEDVLSGVAAGRAGNYGVVIGVAELLSA